MNFDDMVAILSADKEDGSKQLLAYKLTLLLPNVDYRCGLFLVNKLIKLDYLRTDGTGTVRPTTNGLKKARELKSSVWNILSQI